MDPQKSGIYSRPGIYFCYNAVCLDHQTRPGVYARQAIILGNMVDISVYIARWMTT